MQSTRYLGLNLQSPPSLQNFVFLQKKFGLDFFWRKKNLTRIFFAKKKLCRNSFWRKKNCVGFIFHKKNLSRHRLDSNQRSPKGPGSVLFLKFLIFLATWDSLGWSINPFNITTLQTMTSISSSPTPCPSPPSEVLAQAACVRHACLRAPCVAWPLIFFLRKKKKIEQFFHFLRPAFGHGCSGHPQSLEY